MINRNVELTQINIGVFDIRILSAELNDLYKRYGGMVNVKISKPEAKGTEEQNRAMHSLLTEYYKSGYHSAPEGYTLAQFKIWMKLQYGPVYDMYIDGKDIKVPKSWSDYSKQERSDFIDGLVSEVKQSGAYNDFVKIREILDGMEINA
jgi:hypothetical protein